MHSQLRFVSEISLFRFHTSPARCLQLNVSDNVLDYRDIILHSFTLSDIYRQPVKNKMFQTPCGTLLKLDIARCFISRDWIHDYLIKIIILPFTFDDPCNEQLNMELLAFLSLYLLIYITLFLFSILKLRCL